MRTLLYNSPPCPATPVMSDSGDEADSRTASVGIQRPRSTQSSNRGDSNSRPTKKQRRNRNRADRDANDFVPRGAAFSANALQVDPDETSTSDSASDSAKSDAPVTSTAANPHAGSTAPAISWNQGRKSAVRTTLGKRKAPVHTQEQGQALPEANSAGAEQFKAVNGAYWRSRSASVSSAARSNRAASVEEGEVDSRSDSDDSESLDSEADDSILLNIGAKSGDGADDYDPASLVLDHGPTNGHTNGVSQAKAPVPPSQLGSKEDAFRLFSQKYPTAPTTLVDLIEPDMGIQAKFLYWDRDINDIDLNLPIGCTECLQQGHLAEVCPTKECPSALKSSASEIPCDLCGSSEHVESQCDYQWKFPMREATAQEITVSISCARCVSSSHLIGDCPSLRQPLKTTSFSLKGIDPAHIINLNTQTKLPPPPPTRAPSGKGRRGAPRSPSSESEDMLPRRGRRPPPPAPSRGKPRGGAIRFGNGFAANGRGGSDKSRGKPPNRGRMPPPGNNTRQRSISPYGQPRRGPPPPRGGGGNRGRGGGRGGRARRGK
ncbi:uncharacterized protein N7459_009407 [Penicillium hispanicum]|uniref:uncharacterized protein n=1 Tax=Penicillium hispanicum TaxID=1080232 RepID=UPI002540056F|nr:uncharacterized protein N7459_009407 [Penicillium hispanicum]KAJ5569977.1 hypothetical protein N7459_009407 [Penicillium hispanicum]